MSKWVWNANLFIQIGEEEREELVGKSDQVQIQLRGPSILPIHGKPNEQKQQQAIKIKLGIPWMSKSERKKMNWMRNIYSLDSMSVDNEFGARLTRLTAIVILGLPGMGNCVSLEQTNS